MPEPVLVHVPVPLPVLTELVQLCLVETSIVIFLALLLVEPSILGWLLAGLGLLSLHRILTAAASAYEREHALCALCRLPHETGGRWRPGEAADEFELADM